MKNEVIKVAFRKENDGTILAVFDVLWSGYDLTGYAHIGQHTGVSLEYYRNCTKPANPVEYAGLLSELVSIGYDNLQIVKRLPLRQIYR